MPWISHAATGYEKTQVGALEKRLGEATVTSAVVAAPF